jgi:hypothetical protein
MENDKLRDLMPTINPNLDEIAEGNEPLQPVSVAEAPKNNEIFVCSNKKIKKSCKLQNKITELPKDEKKLEKTDRAEMETPKPPNKELPKDENKPAKKKYPHLEKARAKALENRRKKAQEKAELKEAERIKKEQLKEEKKNLRIEKNRKNNRENYRKKKGLDDEGEKETIIQEEKEVWKESITQEPIKNSGLSYEEFESYMNRYVNKNKPVKKPLPKKPPVVKKVRIKEPPKPVSNHPTNYYNPHQRNKFNVDDLFSL